jgi:uncharacterized protein (TIGR03437 family)
LPSEIRGKADLAVAGISGGVRIKLGNGDGSFRAPLLYSSNPGLWTGDFNGDGRTDLLTGSGNCHGNSSNRLVDASNPTTAGKTIVIYCTGLGPVAPDQPASGFPAPGNPLLHTTTPISVAIANIDAPVLFSGLVPGLVGVYQVNAVVPPGIDRSYPPGVTITVKGGVAVNFAAPTIVVK